MRVSEVLLVKKGLLLVKKGLLLVKKGLQLVRKGLDFPVISFVFRLFLPETSLRGQ